MRKLNKDSVELDGVDTADYPKFVDAFISRAEWDDGTELTDDEIDRLNSDSFLLYELIQDSIGGE
jgi:hypothetical protein